MHISFVKYDSVAKIADKSKNLSFNFTFLEIK
jgi:hypothetical protein